MAPDTYHHPDLRNALLDSVRELIREHGLAEVSLREAARRAGVSHSAPAHHFVDKAGMLTAFAIQGYEMFADRMQAAFEAARSEDGADPFTAIGIEYVQFAVDHPEHFSMMFRSELVDHDAPGFHETRQRAFGVLLSAIEESDLSRSADGDALHVAIGAWSQVHGLATLWLDGALQDVTDEDISSIAAALCNTEPGRASG